jgi:hypothetical protein
MSGAVYFARAGDFLVSTDEESLRLIRKLGEGEAVAFKPLRTRSVLWHRRYWALMTQVSVHIETINISLGREPVLMPVTCAEDLHTAIKLITGYCTTQHIAGTGYVLRIPRSTSFAEMTADEWSQYYPKVLDAIHERALPQIEIPEVANELARLAS